MQEIRLQHGVWNFDPTRQLGEPGGFGEVFFGERDGEEVAVKRLKLSASDAAHREIQISEALFGRDLKHVIPVLDFGLDAESDQNFIVMPLADRSLHAELQRRGLSCCRF
jgi:serine/threonine-protein kinase